MKVKNTFGKPYLLTSKNKCDIDVDYTVNMAIGYVKNNPCCICGYEPCCEIKYKGTCPVWRELKARLYNL